MIYDQFPNNLNYIFFKFPHFKSRLKKIRNNEIKKIGGISPPTKNLENIKTIVDILHFLMVLFEFVIIGWGSPSKEDVINY